MPLARQAETLTLVLDILLLLERRLFNLFVATYRYVGWYFSRIPVRFKGTTHGWWIRSSERESPPVGALAKLGSAILSCDILAR